MKRKIKKAIAKEVLKEITADYGFTNEITVSPLELRGVEAQVSAQGHFTRAIYPISKDINALH